MAETPSIYERLQVGKQTVFGTAVAATRRLGAVNGSFVPHTESAQYKPAGYKFTTVSVPLKEWSEITIADSPMTYDEIVYLLDSLIATATPTGNGTSTPYIRTYEPSVDGSQTRTIYTVESGSADRARDIQDAVVAGLSFTLNRSGCTLSGSMLGKAMLDNQSLTGGLSVLPLVPIAPTQVSIKLAATQAGLAGASAQTRNFDVSFSLNNLSNLVWPLNGAVDFAAHVDTQPEGSGSFTLQVNNDGMTPLTYLRNGSTYFMRIAATGPVIAGITPTANCALQIDVAMKIKNLQFNDHEGTQVAQWDYDIAYDGTWGKALLITVTNGVATV